MKPLLWLLLGLIAFAAFLLVRAPASLVEFAAPDIGGERVALSAFQGTLWQGAATASAGDAAVGRLSWRMRPGELLRGAVALSWRLTRSGRELSGYAERFAGGAAIGMSGDLDAAALNPVLAPYHIRLGGTFSADALDVTFDGDGNPARGSGTLKWDGGYARYRLAGVVDEALLPPMRGELFVNAAVEPQLNVRVADAPEPVLTARLDDRGWLHIGLSRRFTVLAGRPWPTPGDPDAIVVEVAEKLYP